MRMPVRSTFDLCLAAMAMVLGFALDVSLVSVLKANLQRTLAVPRYRAVYLRSGRRNRVRY